MKPVGGIGKVYLVFGLCLFCNIITKPCLMMVSLLVTGFKPLS